MTLSSPLYNVNIYAKSRFAISQVVCVFFIVCFVPIFFVLNDVNIEQLEE